MRCEVHRFHHPARRTLAATAAALLALLAFASIAFAETDPLEAEARAIAHQLRCPICETVSVADSPSQLAQEMRAVIRQKLAEGMTREEVLAYFRERYGDEVLLEPPREGRGALVWWTPVVAVVLGGALTVAFVRRWLWQSSGPSPDPLLSDRTPDRPDLEERLEAELQATRETSS
ncbi:MAG TPA: cytochrome c-type biogenesis protein [Chloroflexota bacterium]